MFLGEGVLSWFSDTYLHFGFWRHLVAAHVVLVFPVPLQSQLLLSPVSRFPCHMTNQPRYLSPSFVSVLCLVFDVPRCL